MQSKLFAVDKIELAYGKLMLDNMPGAGTGHMTGIGTRMTHIILKKTGNRL